MPSYLDYHGLQTFKGELDQIFATKMDAAKRGVSNGVASLDATGKVPIEQLPNGVGVDIIDDTAGAGDTDKTWSANKLVEELSHLDPDVPVEDVQVNGTSVVVNGVANVPKAGASSLGVVKPGNGLDINTDGSLKILVADDNQLKAGSQQYGHAIVPANQHKSIFYGLSKLAGVDLASETATIGTYPASAKAAIQSMLGVEVGVVFVEEISSTTPTITGEANTRYICGEVSTIDITPPSAGTIDVIFESGTTPAVLTIPNTVKFPSWVDLTTLEADTIYEIMITDGTLGAVMTWSN